MIANFHEFLKNESGATAIEYSLIASLLGLSIIASAKLIRGELASSFTTVSTELKNATN
jgi:pilus assembly protein Flp/PilA